MFRFVLMEDVPSGDDFSVAIAVDINNYYLLNVPNVSRDDVAVLCRPGLDGRVGRNVVVDKDTGLLREKNDFGSPSSSTSPKPWSWYFSNSSVMRCVSYVSRGFASSGWGCQ